MMRIHPQPTERQAIEGFCPILMLVYDGWDLVFAGLAAMRPVTDHIWLIDNGSPTNRTEEIREAFPEVRIISTGSNLGWAGGYNFAIGIAAREGFDMVYLLNSDAVLRSGAVVEAVETLHANEDAAAVGSMILHKNGTSVLFDGDWDWHSLPGVTPLREDLREVRTIHGAGFALSLAAYKAIGPFHEQYFLYHEEIDWCLRAEAAGWRLLVNCKSRVEHAGEGSSTGQDRLYYIARNRFLAMRRGIAIRECQETVLSIIEHEYINAISLSYSQQLAITSGIIDGILGRFGPRREPYPTLVITCVNFFMLVSVRAKRKLRAILGVV